MAGTLLKELYPISKRHQEEMDWIRNEGRSGLSSPTTMGDRKRREAERWDEEMYEAILDYVDRRPKPKQKSAVNPEQERRRASFQNAMSRAGGAYKPKT